MRLGWAPASQVSLRRVEDARPDDSWVNVYNDEDEPIMRTAVTPHRCLDTGVPTGGDCKVKDAESNNGQGATGNYKIV